MKSKLTSILAALALPFLAACDRPPLTALVNVQKAYPNSRIAYIDPGPVLNKEPSHWLVVTENDFRVVRCDDHGEVVGEQVLPMSDDSGVWFHGVKAGSEPSSPKP